jgi:DNA-binding NarL/FixJ family response regulator
VAHGRSCGPVLVIDDDEPARAEIVRLLVETGLSTVEAASGEEGLRRARRDRPSLVVLEVALPRLSGYEVCHKLREEFGESLPILFVSTDRVEPRDRVAGLYVGGDDYLAKPFHAGEFLARVARLLRRDGVVQAPGASASGLTRRELEILGLLAAGVSQRGIASTLVISPRTVGTHIQSILGKLGVHSRTEAVARAYQDGLVERSR